MAQTLVRKVMLKIAADDGDTEAKLDRIDAKARQLAAEHPDLTPRINTAAASAKLAVLRKELKDTQQQSDETRFSLRDLGGAVNGLVTGIPSGVGEMTTFQKAMAAFNLATGLAEPLLAAATVGGLGLGGALVSAGAGAGVFELAAKSAFSQVETADKANKKLTGGLGELQRQLGTATNDWNAFGKSASPGVAMVLGKALGLIPQALKLAQPFLKPTEEGLDHIIGSLSKAMDSAGAKSFFGDLAKNSGTDLDKLAVAAGHVAIGIGGILRAFMPMSGTVLSGLDKITARFETWGSTLTSHNGFQNLMSMAKQDAPLVIRVLTNLAGIIKTVAGEMTGMDTAANSRTLLQLAGTVSGLVNSLLKAHPQLVWLALYFKMGLDGASKLKTGINGVRDSLGALATGKKAVSDFAGGFKDAEQAADDASGAWGTVGGKVSTVLGGIKSMAVAAAEKLGLLKTATTGVTEATELETGAQEELDVAMDANPVGLIILAVAGLVIGIVELARHSAAFRDFWKGAWKDISKAAVAAWHVLDNDVLHPIEHGISDTVSFIRSHWQAVLVGVLTGPVGLAAMYIVTHFHQIVTGAENTVSRVGSFFASLPGRIVHAVGDLGHLLWSAGERVIQGLIGGIESEIGSVGSAMGSIAGEIKDFLPFSPAKKGPLSGAGAPRNSGLSIGRQVREGLDASAGSVSQAAARLARAAQLGTAAARPALAGAGGYSGKLQIEWVGGQGDQQFLTWIKKNIRIRGGDVGNLGR